MPKVVLVNSLYELESWCTSIIAKMQNGTIIHSRNLDFDNASLMRTITYTATFERDGKYLFDATMFAGTVGIYTGMRAGAFSISENQRQFNEQESGLIENILMLFSGYSEISWLIRETLTVCSDFDCAYYKLKDDPVCALGYIILAGTHGDDGVVISRNRFDSAHRTWLNSSINQWFIVQTNNDHWDTGCYNRCAMAVERMIETGQQNISPVTIRSNVLYLFPNENYATIYNTEYTPVSGAKDTVPLTYTSTSEDDGRTLVMSSRSTDRPFSMGQRLRELNKVYKQIKSTFN